MDNPPKYIEVAVALPLFNNFTYIVSEELSYKIGVAYRVLVPFGNRTVTGYVIRFKDEPDTSSSLKEIIEILDDKPLFPESMIELFKWISDYYIYPLGEVIQCALPGGLNLSQKTYLKLTENGLIGTGENKDSREKKILSIIKSEGLKRSVLNNQKVTINEKDLFELKKKGLIVEEKRLKGATSKIKQARFLKPVNTNKPIDSLTEKRIEIVKFIRETGEISINELKKNFKNINSFIKPLNENGFIDVYYKDVYRDPFGEEIEPDTAKKLTGEQKKVVDEVSGSLCKGFSSFLLAGVTGSGKTEVYLQIAEEAINRELDVIVLVPEISLISQTERRFRARFGDKIAVLHSGLSHGERFDQWRKIANKEVSISIGVRSSIFSPFSKPGLIIVDEEHDQSYKQESTLRYNARDIALVRGKISQCPVLLGSATPSVQSSFNAMGGKFKELELKNRINKMPLPKIDIVDLKKYRDFKGIRKYVSDELLLSIGKTLKNKEQVMLFLNRRGFSTYPVCSKCGETVKCLDCETSLTLHKRVNAYKCHLCGYSKASVSKCVQCGSDKIKLLGIGTEKIEELMVSLYPEAKVARLDQDTTKGKNSMVKVLKRMRERKIDILIGTQMIAKGHDFPEITLVGILCADMSLNFPDFRASERTFQLIAQVAGRSGRGESEGRVILQTYNPDHFSIKAAERQDFKEFFLKEISFRKSLMFPPLTRMIQIKISGKSAQNTKNRSEDIGFWCKELLKKHNKYSIDVMGPVEAPLSKVAGRFRWQILLKCINTGYLNSFVRAIKNEYFSKLKKDIRVTIDVDPFSML